MLFTIHLQLRLKHKSVSKTNPVLLQSILVLKSLDRKQKIYVILSNPLYDHYNLPYFLRSLDSLK